MFLDPYVVWDDPAGDWGRLAWRIGLSGVPDVQAALQDQLLEPARIAVDSLFRTQVLRDIAGAGLAASDAAATTLVDSALEALAEPLAAVGRAVGATAGRGASVHKVQATLARRLVDLVAAMRAGRVASAPPRPGTPASAAMAPTTDQVELARWVGTDRARWATLVSWAVGASLGDLVRASTPGAVVGVYDAWAAGSAVARTVGELGLADGIAVRVAGMVRALLAVPLGALGDSDPAGSLDQWLQAPAVRAATGWNEWRGATYVGQEPFEEWLGALAARDVAGGATGAFDAAASLVGTVASNEFRVAGPGTVEPAG